MCLVVLFQCNYSRANPTCTQCWWDGATGWDTQDPRLCLVCRNQRNKRHRGFLFFPSVKPRGIASCHVPCYKQDLSTQSTLPSSSSSCTLRPNWWLFHPQLSQLPPELQEQWHRRRHLLCPGFWGQRTMTPKGQHPSLLLPKSLEREWEAKAQVYGCCIFSGVLNKHEKVYLKKLFSSNKQLGKRLGQLEFHNQHLWVNFRFREDLEMTSLMFNRA